jgi:hypothetical protein
MKFDQFLLHFADLVTKIGIFKSMNEKKRIFYFFKLNFKLKNAFEKFLLIRLNLIDFYQEIPKKKTSLKNKLKKQQKNGQKFNCLDHSEINICQIIFFTYFLTLWIKSAKNLKKNNKFAYCGFFLETPLWANFSESVFVAFFQRTYFFFQKQSFFKLCCKETFLRKRKSIMS